MISEQDQYTNDDLDECLDTVMEAISIMNNKELMALVKARAKEKGKHLLAIKEFSADTDDGKINSIEDLKDKKYEAFKSKEDKKPKVKSIKDLRDKAKEKEE